MTMHKQNGMYYGYADIDIVNVMKALPEMFSFSDMLVTCIDSNASVSSLSIWLKALDHAGCKYNVAGNAILIPCYYVKNALDNWKMFTVFDEMYLLPEQSPAPHFGGKIFTTDWVNFGQCVPAEFLETFSNLKAVRYLSGGCGLNFVCDKASLAESIRHIESKVLGVL